MNNIFAQGGVIAVIGILTVFTVLAILWIVLELMHVFFAGKKKAAPKKETAPAKKPAVPTPVASAPAEDEGELIAVLTAAVATMLDKPASSLSIKSYRRVGTTTPVWNRMARQDNLNR